MSHRVRVGVVSTSNWADRAHLPALKSHPRADIAAICGRNRVRAEEMANKYDVPRVFTDYREMIERGNLDALIVAVPDDLHYSVTMDALDAGLHVVCEKPLALNVEQARAMYEKAQAARVKHMVFFTWRWMPHFQYLKELVDAGHVGVPLVFHGEFLMGYGWDGEYRWRFDRRRANGVLGDLGSHMIDFARWYMGDISRVSSHLATFASPANTAAALCEPANDSVLLMLEFENGSQGMIHVSVTAHVGERRADRQIRLYGRSGTLESHFGDSGAEIRGVRQDEGPFRVLPVPDRIWGDVDRNYPFGVLTRQPVGDRLFIDAILEDRPLSPSFHDGLKVQEVIEAAVESHTSGRWVSVASG